MGEPSKGIIEYTEWSTFTYENLCSGGSYIWACYGNNATGNIGDGIVIQPPGVNKSIQIDYIEVHSAGGSFKDSDCNDAITPKSMWFGFTDGVDELIPVAIAVVKFTPWSMSFPDPLELKQNRPLVLRMLTGCAAAVIARGRIV